MNRLNYLFQHIVNGKIYLVKLYYVDRLNGESNLENLKPDHEVRLLFKKSGKNIIITGNDIGGVGMIIPLQSIFNIMGNDDKTHFQFYVKDSKFAFDITEIKN